LLQIIGATYIIRMLALFSGNKSQFDLAVVLDVLLSPLGLVAIAFIVVLSLRRRRF
jgi:hypothetical protein